MHKEFDQHINFYSETLTNFNLGLAPFSILSFNSHTGSIMANLRSHMEFLRITTISLKKCVILIISIFMFSQGISQRIVLLKQNLIAQISHPMNAVKENGGAS